MYEGRTDVEKGKILGHENLGEVVEVGKAVDTVKTGDKVVLPFNVGCGFCANCERGLSGYCLTCADPKVMPGMAGAAYGLVKELGATPINSKDDNVGDQIRELTGGLGADCGAECVGYQCHNSHGEEVPNITMNALVDSVKATGTIGVIGVFVPQDPGADDKLAKKGQIAFDFGKANPSLIISHELPLDKAPEAYKHFDNRDNGWTKVILHPHAFHAHAA
jgi:threonine dehydrogenase-like Zn-dependent dehydrogenase